MTDMTVMGIDPGLTAMGVAVANASHDYPILRTITDGGQVGHKRLGFLRDQMAKIIEISRPSLALIEDYAYMKGRGAHQLGEIGGVIRVLLLDYGVEIIDSIGPTQLKKWATGAGNASKDRVHTMMQLRLGDGAWIEDTHQADAIALHWLGVEAAGLWHTPMHGRSEDATALGKVREELPRWMART